MNIWQDSNNAVTNSIPNSSTANEDVDWHKIYQRMDKIRQEENKVIEQQLGYWQIKHNWPNVVTIVNSEGISVNASKETLDKIFGTEEEISKEPKASISFRIIDLSDERNNKRNN